MKTSNLRTPSREESTVLPARSNERRSGYTTSQSNGRTNGQAAATSLSAMERLACRDVKKNGLGDASKVLSQPDMIEVDGVL